MFCSGRPKNHIRSSWFLNRAGNSDHCYSLVGVPTPENLTLWWEPKRNTLYLEDRTQDASQHLNPFLNALTAAGFAASGVTVSSQLLKDCPCSIMPRSSCKADGNPVPLWQTYFGAQLKPSHGVYFTCRDKAYLSLPPFWSGTCSLGYVTPHLDLAWSNISLPLLVYTNQRICRAVILTPLFLALGLTAGLTGAAMGRTSLHKFQQLSTDTAVSIEKTVRTLQCLQSQLDSLAAMVLQNRRALDLLTAGQGGTCLYLKEECCFYYNQTGQVQEDIKGLLEQATKIWDLSSTDAWSSPSFPSCFLLFMGQVITILLGLLFGPMYTPTPYKIYLQQTPPVPSQTDISIRMEAGFRCGTSQLRSSRERHLLC